MEEELSFVLMLPLKEMALRRVTVNLWKEPEILALFEKDYTIFSERWIESVKNKVTDKMSKLMLPQSLMKKILVIVAPVGVQIQKWKRFHKYYLESKDWRGIPPKYLIRSDVELDAPILAKLCWTSIGTIDYRKTAEELVHCKMLEIVKRYKLACLYCFHDCIPSLWEELSEEIKGQLYNEKVASEIRSVNLQFCWPYILKGELSKLDCMTTKFQRYPTTFYLHAFEYSARQSNKAATEYFFQKLTQEEKEISLVRTAGDVLVARLFSTAHKFPSENLVDVLCYLFFQMNHDQKVEVLKKHSRYVSSRLLIWPFHEIFLKIADHIWPFFSTEDYIYLVEEMNIHFEEWKFYFPNFFQEFFPDSHVNFRKEFVNIECQRAEFIRGSFEVEDSETLKVIFRNVEAADRVRLLSSERIFILFHYYILKGKCDMIRLCLREARLSKEDRERLKEALMAWGTNDIRDIQLRTRVLNEYFRFLAEIDANA